MARNIVEYISNGKNIKTRPIDLSHKDKCIAYCSKLPLEIIFCFSYINFEIMNIISSDVDIYDLD